MASGSTYNGLKALPGSYMAASLPEYANPPVIETVLGVQFKPIDGLESAHLGAFWKSIEKDWPHVSDAQPLEPQIETFNNSSLWGQVGIQLRLNRPGVRLRIKNTSGNQMIQVQNGRFHLNWLGEAGGSYPHFVPVVEKFFETFALFRNFLRGARFEEPAEYQWEVAYVNHIERGTVWQTPRDWTFFKLLSNCEILDERLPLESLGAEWHREIPRQRGRLHIQWKHGSKDKDGSTEMVVLTLTARGPVNAQSETGTLKHGLDLGHEAIVTTFRELMTDKANRYWGLKDGNS